MEFSRLRILEYLPFPSPGDLPDSGTEPGSPALQAESSSEKPVVSYMSHHRSPWLELHAKKFKKAIISKTLLETHTHICA